MLEFLLSSAGITLIITMSFLFKPLRKWFHIRAEDKEDIMGYPYSAHIVWIYLDKLICCSQCTGFWVGLLVALFINPIYQERIWYVNNEFALYVSIFLCGAMSSCFSYLLAMIIKYLECRIAEMEKQ